MPFKRLNQPEYRETEPVMVEGKEAVSGVGDICSGLTPDKVMACNIIVDRHANYEMKDGEAEEELSKLKGEEVKLMEKPEYVIMPTDRNVLEAWSTGVCSTFAKDEQQKQMCIDQVEKSVLHQQTIEEAAQKIATLTREDPHEIQSMIVNSAPTIRDTGAPPEPENRYHRFKIRAQTRR